MNKDSLLKINIWAVFIVGTIFGIISLINEGLVMGVTLFVGAYTVVIIMIIARRTLPLQVCIYLIATIAYFAMFLPPMFNNRAIEALTILMGYSLAFGLYFQKRLIIYLAIMTNASLIIFIFGLGIGLPEHVSYSAMVSPLMQVNVTFVLLYILVVTISKFLDRMQKDDEFKTAQLEEQRQMTGDLSTLVHEYVNQGDVEYRIDKNNYKDIHNQDVVEGINSMVQASVDDMNTLISVMKSISDGNFNITIHQFPGKKIIANEVIDEFTKHLSAVRNAIIEAKSAVVKGNLNFTTDTSGYNGDWKEIINGLNVLSEAVSNPISEIKEVMLRLDNGYTDETVDGDYAGEFLVIKDTVNRTINNLSVLMKEISTVLAALAKGDLTTRTTLEYHGEFSVIKESINDISRHLHRTISDIATAADHVLTNAKQLDTSASELNKGSIEQASNIEELHASVEIIANKTNFNSNNAEKANILSDKSTENAKVGNNAMKQLLESMVQIKDSSNSISKVIQVIQGISSQTNLLALNAAVEAARAGEHGKGFNVVAEEVRSLAIRSQEAATNTTELIKNSIERVDTSSDIALSTSEALDTIVDNTENMLNIISNIATSSKEQNNAISDVSLALTQISAVVQSNSTASEMTATAATDLKSQAVLLKQLVEYFKV